MSADNNSTASHNKSEMVYQKLAGYLDEMPAGFPATEDGLEIRLLKRFFSPDEAELALHVTLIPEEVRVLIYTTKFS